MKSCPEFVMLAQLLTGKLSEADFAVLEQHLLGCDTCRTELDRLNGEVQMDVNDDPYVIAAEAHVFLARLKQTPPQECAVPETDLDLYPPVVPGYVFNEGEDNVKFGGMGVVYFGIETSLNRPVAVKVLRQTLAGEVQHAGRFGAEAQICAQLQHPGIVPVYQVGKLSDRRPFYVMKLVKGDTLADVLKKRSSPSADLFSFLTQFRRVCEAMGYAHAHNVIHRDLKPANIMTGAYDEVLLMDWGLAKVLGQGGTEDPEPPSRAIKVLDDGKRSPTQGGLGTIAYMSPEQANGDMAQVDRRSDVFGLGAILCFILTGRPPYVGPNDEMVLRQAMRADLAGAHDRLGECGADAKLLALTLQCLSRQREDRPADGSAVAQVIRDYLDGVEEAKQRAKLEQRATEVRAQEREVQAEMERKAAEELAQERLRQAELNLRSAEARADLEGKFRAVAEAKTAAERKRRLVTVALAVVVIVGGVGIWKLQEQWSLRQAEKDQAAAAAARRAEERDRDIQAGLAETAVLRDQGRLGEARKTLEGAEKLVADGAPAALAERARQARKDLDMVAELAEAPLTGPLAGFDPGAVAESYRKAFQQYGIDMEALDPAEAAARIRASDIREQLIVALDDWASRLPVAPALVVRLLDAAERADDDKLRHELRRPGRGRQDFEEWLDRYDISSVPPTTAMTIYRKLYLPGSVIYSKHALRSEQFLRKAQQAYPNDFWVNYSLFKTLFDTARLEEAIGFLRVAVALRPDSPAAHNSLGVALKWQGRPKEAEWEYRRAIKLKDYAGFRINLGSLLAELGEWPEAEKEFRRAILLKKDYPEAHYSLGTLLALLSKQGEAEKEFSWATKIKPDYPEAHLSLGLNQIAQGNFDGAILSFKQAREWLPPDDPRHPQVEKSISRCNDLLELDKKLPTVLKGEIQVSADDWVEFAFVCQCKQRYKAAAFLYAEAFFVKPALADDLATKRRYWAACAAALAGVGLGGDASDLDDKERVHLRNTALDWLRANLTALDKLRQDYSKAHPKIQYELRRWQADDYLAGVREAGALAKLPEAEREAWRKLWADVDAFVKELGDGNPAPPPTP